MTITLEPPSPFVKIDGVNHRVWQGCTERGVEIHAYIARVAAVHGSDTGELEAALRQTRPLRPELKASPSSLTSQGYATLPCATCVHCLPRTPIWPMPALRPITWDP